MSKGNSNGLMRGKLGNKVLYAITNSNNKETQGERAYVANVANPKTIAQAVQRMKLAPAVNFYRAFKQEVLNHSWQGVKYGGRSHAYFMSQVMKSKDAIYPFVPKGTTELIPGQFPVSRGSLPGVLILSLTSSSGSISNFATHNLIFDDEVGASPNIWIDWTLNQNNGILKFGDQITFVAIIHNSTGNFFPLVRRLVLDPAHYPSASTMGDIFNITGLAPSDDRIGFWSDDNFMTLDIAAAAIIISRPQVSKTTGEVTWLRSNADMFVDPDIIAQYNSQEAYDAAITTYLKSGAAVSSDWYLNDGSYNGAAAKIPVAPGIESAITDQQYQVTDDPFFGHYIARSFNAEARTNKWIVKRNGLTITAYSLSDDMSEQGSGNVLHATSTRTWDEGYEQAADEQMANFEANGGYITPEQAVAEQAALGNTYTIAS